MAYDNTNRGALFKNDKKEKDTHPDYRGQINIDGVDCWLDGWLKISDSGRKYFSLSVKVKEAKREEKPSKPAPRRRDDDDDVPF